MSYLESEALCPYYQQDKFGILKCEIGDLRMRDSQMMRDVGYRLCADGYMRCPFKIALDSFYERNADAEPLVEEESEQIGLW